MTLTPAAPPLTWFERTRELAVTLTGWPSVTGSADETAFAAQLQTLLRSWPAFADHPEDVWLLPARAGHDAWNVYALVRGSSPRTVLLSGHYDTVSTEDYGAWRPLACSPAELTARVQQALIGDDLAPGEALAARDLASGEYVMGRGLLDMKGGVAAGLAVLERYAALPLHERPGHLLLVASPDEEGRSSGARAVAHDLPGLAGTLGLNVVAGINLDATADVGNGEDGRAAYLGSVGKVLLSAFVVGRPAHAAYPFDGVSAALLAARLVARIETAPDLADGSELADSADAEAAAPPVCLELRDGKPQYDVTSPASVWCAFNVLTHQRSPSQVLAQFMTVIRSVADDTLLTFAEHARQAGSLNALSLASLRTEVLTLGTLRERATAKAGEAAVQALQQLPAGPDPLRASREITAALVALAGLEGPAVVVGFGALHYPHTRLGAEADDRRLHGAVTRHAADLARESGQSLRVRQYFAGISDMSFLGQQAHPFESATLAQHTPHAGHVDPLPQDALRFPVVNIGPWGRDYHQRLERIHAPYAFQTVPELLWRVCHTVLTAE